MKKNEIRRRSAGFTLIELMITVAVVALLAAVALPSYRSQVRKSHRTEAKNAVLDLAGREESLYATTHAYSGTASDLGYSTFTPVGNGGYYNVTITPSSPTNTFTITATAIGDQANDTSCKTFVVTQTGAQSATDSSGADSTSTCWK